VTASLPLVPWPASVEPREGTLPFAALYLVSQAPDVWTALAAELFEPLGVVVSGGETVAAVRAGWPRPDAGGARPDDVRRRRP